MAAMAMWRCAKRLAGIVFCAAALCTIFWVMIPPPPAVWEGLELSRVVRDRQGGVLLFTRTSDDQFRARVRLEEIAPHVVEATLAYEDRFFYLHPGVNPVSLARSAVRYLVTREPRFGASTLSMQAARLRWKLETRTVRGKLLQIWRALQLERHLGKREILELYYTLTPYGRNYQGIAAAAFFYLDKTPAELTPREAVALAVIPQNPAARTPRAGESNKRLDEAAARLARKMSGRFGLPQHGVGVGVALDLRAPRLFRAQHFALAALRDAGRDAHDVETTLEPVLQDVFRREIGAWLRENSLLGVRNAAAMLVSHNGEVLAYVGSANFFDLFIQGQNDMLQAPRSPGSTLKPFVYALALQAGQIHTSSLLLDHPKAYAEYSPENDDRDYIGPVRADVALVRSRNVPAVRLAEKLPAPGLYGFLKSNGVRLSRAEQDYGLAIVLGGVEVRAVDLARLYLILANHGRGVPLRFLKGSRRGGSSVTQERENLALMPEAAWLALYMLRSAGGHLHEKLARQFPPPVAWKTGTSPRYRDAWCVGVTGGHVIVVWAGNADGSPSPNLKGQRAALPLMVRLLAAARNARREIFSAEFVAPPTGGRIMDVEVCALSRMATTAHTPKREWTKAIRGVTELRPCDVHRPVQVDVFTGEVRAHAAEVGSTRVEVREFWPPEFLESFRLAGRPREQNWQLASDNFPTVSAAVVRPEIVSPQSGSRIVLEAVVGGRVYLRARPLPGDPELHWFINETYLGRARSSGVVEWLPRRGANTVTACTSTAICGSVRVVVE